MAAGTRCDSDLSRTIVRAGLGQRLSQPDQHSVPLLPDLAPGHADHSISLRFHCHVAPAVGFERRARRMVRKPVHLQRDASSPKEEVDFVAAQEDVRLRLRQLSSPRHVENVGLQLRSRERRILAAGQKRPQPPRPRAAWVAGDQRRNLLSRREPRSLRLRHHRFELPGPQRSGQVQDRARRRGHRDPVERRDLVVPQVRDAMDANRRAGKPLRPAHAHLGRG